MEDSIRSKDLFLNHVANHRLTILRDDGIYRHLRFQSPRTWNMHFDIITWPGHLCYAGDMGNFVFARLPDMLDFFRHGKKGDERWGINPDYWAKKLQSISCFGGLDEFDEDEFIRVINETLDEIEADDDLRDEVCWMVLDKVQNGGQVAVDAAFNFRPPIFQDIWERSFKRHTFYFIWCCHALVWGIREYDAAKQGA